LVLILQIAGLEEAKNLAGKCPPLIQTPFGDAEFWKNLTYSSRGNVTVSPNLHVGLRLTSGNRFVAPHGEKHQAPAVPQTRVTAIVNIAFVIADSTYHFCDCRVERKSGRIRSDVTGKETTDFIR